MAVEVTYEQVVEKLNLAANPTERRMYFAALLSKAADISTDDIIVVGGSAIEFYTVGEYTSGDIDIVSIRSEHLKGVLGEWNFHTEGRIWLNERLGIVVDFVPYPYTGDETKTQILSTPYGSIRVAALEDLLVKRLASAKHWERKGDFDQARLLAVLFRDRMDWGYVEDIAKEYNVRDMLDALKRALSEV